MVESTVDAYVSINQHSEEEIESIMIALRKRIAQFYGIPTDEEGNPVSYTEEQW